MEVMHMMETISSPLLSCPTLREDDIYPIAFCSVEYGGESENTYQRKDLSAFIDLLYGDIEVTPVVSKSVISMEIESRTDLDKKIQKILETSQLSKIIPSDKQIDEDEEKSLSIDEESGSSNENHEETEESNDKSVFTIEIIEQVLQRQLTYYEKFAWTKLMRNTYGSTKVYNKLYMCKETDHRWICYYCTAIVEGNMDAFLVHFNEWHSDEKPLLSCNFCPQFRSPKEHQNHIKAHLMENGCSLCDLWCGKSHISYHLDISEVTNSFPVLGDATRFQCKECPKEMQVKFLFN
ncbi:hypothetical protein QYM36_013146 [Artemia franciscana]|uniref:C2H2-type domain-containing protein n=1 Tax=Artemia franciscana TaxID=6661 RepID=A0AA88L644_ARTSF|nr:hypothetical protein QYM36_013146 [Artemia franciscana]